MSHIHLCMSQSFMDKTYYTNYGQFKIKYTGYTFNYKYNRYNTYLLQYIYIDWPFMPLEIWTEGACIYDMMKMTTKCKL